MAGTTQELQVQKKRELESKEETTIPARIFVPAADIYETENELTVILEMPGVEKKNVEVRVEDDVLNVEAGSILRSTKVCSHSIRSTILVTMRGASAFPARLTRARLQLK